MAITTDPSAPTVAGLAGPPSAWGWVVASGAVLILAGLAALAAPGAASVAVTLFLGWLLVIAGVAGIVMGLRTRRAHQRSLDLLYGGVSLLVGLIAVFNPIAGAASFALAFALWLGLRGVFELVGASRSAGSLRTVLILAGLANLLLAVLLIANFPYPALTVLGLFVGLSFLFSGVVSLLAGFQLRRIAHS
ncbi:HdeD family acid-resistance protein [Sphingomonas morindae]|uniref:DUF308 domain-containing protein n=1 Tax=Sphingomonas morindae TaxID=1541170 RepID=A0ABY4X7T8_9SPHN|nr:DUF308 domain-containing protein [Sphingomonas morindae]USI73019.1 DUF308 domain-containing protein [Sphingomonas morindae]